MVTSAHHSSWLGFCVVVCPVLGMEPRALYEASALPLSPSPVLWLSKFSVYTAVT